MSSSDKGRKKAKAVIKMIRDGATLDEIAEAIDDETEPLPAKHTIGFEISEDKT